MPDMVGENTADVPIIALGIGPEIHRDVPTEKVAIVEGGETYLETELYAPWESVMDIADRQIQIERGAAFLLQASQTSHALELARQLPPFELSVNRVLSIFDGLPGAYVCAKDIAAKASSEAKRQELFMMIEAHRTHNLQSSK